MKWYNIVESWKVGRVMKNPPFEITQAMLTDAAEISELVGRLSAGKLSSSPILRRTNRIRTIQGTLAIEQNTLSVEQVTAVLNGKHVIAPLRDIAEVKNAYTVYETMEELDPYSVDSLLAAHGTMMHGLIEEAGLFRSGAMGVADNKGRSFVRETCSGRSFIFPDSQRKISIVNWKSRCAGIRSGTARSLRTVFAGRSVSDKRNMKVPGCNEVIASRLP